MPELSQFRSDAAPPRMTIDDAEISLKKPKIERNRWLAHSRKVIPSTFAHRLADWH